MNAIFCVLSSAGQRLMDVIIAIEIGAYQETHRDNMPPSTRGNARSRSVTPRATPTVSSLLPRQRGKYGNLDWEAHKSKIRRLYIDENRDLADTIRIMKDEFFFEASVKLYKDKFSVWGWQKNLPASHALFMASKAKRRREDDGKKTIFKFGGQTWTEDRVLSSASRIKRTKVTHNPSQDMDVKTPSEVEYETPYSSDSSDAIIQIDSEPENEADTDCRSMPTPHLMWNGLTRTSLMAMKEEALRLTHQGKSSDAESLLLQVRDGLAHVVGATSIDSQKAGYALAELYKEAERNSEADEVIEQMTSEHISLLGYMHRTTQQHMLHCVEILNGWNRAADAVAFLSRCRELSLAPEAGRDRASMSGSSRVRKMKDRKGKGRAKPSVERSPFEIAGSIGPDADPRQIDSALAAAKSHNTADQQSVEILLLHLTQICEAQPLMFPLQLLKSRSELLKFYIKQGTANMNAATFENSGLVFQMVWNFYFLQEDKFESFEMAEAALQLCADIFKGGFCTIAQPLFHQVVEMANTTFGYDDERTVWILITIGIVYQRYVDWDTAKVWFETAFTAVLHTWNYKDGIVRSLQQAMDKKHFSYLSDEGRPFKTIFGVSGITIRPGRLHLE